MNPNGDSPSDPGLQPDNTMGNTTWPQTRQPLAVSTRLPVNTVARQTWRPASLISGNPFAGVAGTGNFTAARLSRAWGWQQRFFRPVSRVQPIKPILWRVSLESVLPTEDSPAALGVHELLEGRRQPGTLERQAPAPVDEIDDAMTSQLDSMMSQRTSMAEVAEPLPVEILQSAATHTATEVQILAPSTTSAGPARTDTDRPGTTSGAETSKTMSPSWFGTAINDSSWDEAPAFHSQSQREIVPMKQPQRSSSTDQGSASPDAAIGESFAPVVIRRSAAPDIDDFRTIARVDTPSTNPLHRLIESVTEPTPMPGLKIRLMPPGVAAPAASNAPPPADANRTTQADVPNTPRAREPAAERPIDLGAIADKVSEIIVQRQRFDRERKGLY